MVWRGRVAERRERGGAGERGAEGVSKRGAGAWAWGSGMHGNLNDAKSQGVRAAVDILEVNAVVAGRGFRGHHAMPVA